MPMHGQPDAKTRERIRDIPIYRDSLERGHFPILEKTEIARGFPENWMTPRLAEALEAGEAEFVLSTGTNHARMQLIRPPYFLLKSYYRLWSEHPDIAHTWREQCKRVSLTTVLATEHIARVNAKKHGTQPDARPALADRWLDERTVYLNLDLDPALWDRPTVERMLEEISLVAASLPSGNYHLDCSSYHLAHLVRKVDEWGLWSRFPAPASIIHAYEFTPANVRRFLGRFFDCAIIDLFGSTELGYLYYSDRNGNYHPFLEEMGVELVPVAPGSTIHSIIVSSVRNPYMPLIRYRSGDCARTRDGSADPARITQFCGREKELLWPDNGLGPVSQGDLDGWISATSPDIFTYRLHTDGKSAVLRYTSFDGFAIEQSDIETLRAKFRNETGIPCQLEHAAHIPIGTSGKYAWIANE
ncbi:hypothetical protein [Sciscionella sediminilitoris]|uniref:hypothetical protein n=1 Tax=Sciscionella sediminilitoris TaxID=1445613 RepID=UPI000A7AD8C0|nr:hypothetical protein [Sciscionella sp. SE31]